MAAKLEPGETASWIEKGRYWIVALALVILIAAYSLVRQSSDAPGSTEQLALFGDALGPLASLFSLFALLAALEAVALQRREFSKMVQEAKQSSRAQEAAALASRAQVAQEEHREVKAFLATCDNLHRQLISLATALQDDCGADIIIDLVPDLPLFCGDDELMASMIALKGKLIDLQALFGGFHDRRRQGSTRPGELPALARELALRLDEEDDSMVDHILNCRTIARRYFSQQLRNDGLDEIRSLRALETRADSAG